MLTLRIIFPKVIPVLIHFSESSIAHCGLPNSTDALRYLSYRHQRPQRHQIRQLSAPLRRRRKDRYYIPGPKAENSRHDPIAATPEFVAYNSHTPYELRVSADAIAAGFYQNLTALQGQRNTYWTGAAFDRHDSGDLWAFTAGLLPRIAA